MARPWPPAVSRRGWVWRARGAVLVEALVEVLVEANPEVRGRGSAGGLAEFGGLGLGKEATPLKCDGWDGAKGLMRLER